jgi:glycosyltransferase involved in cell wall biosynthesis
MSRVSKFKNVTHVFLAQKMANDFVSVYRSDVKSLICSNAFVLSPATKINSESAIEQDDNAGVVFGFLSNITTEKGFFELIDIFSSASEHVKDIRLIIAGPVTDLVCQEYLNGASSNVNVEYIGAIYGEEKLKFYQNIDVFLFPTLYKNEAQPLVLYEAINSGTPVLSYDRGCIYEQLYGSELSMVVSGKEEMLLRIVDLANNSELLGAFNNCAVQLNEQLISKSKNELDCFVTSFYRR